MKPDEFKKAINNISKRSNDRGYYIWGNEDYIKGALISAIKEAVVSPDFAEFNCHEFWAGDLRDCKILFDAVLAIPMMADKRLVVLREVDKARKDLLVKLPALSIPDGCVFIAEANPSRKNVVYHKNLLSLLTPIECTLKNDREMVAWVLEMGAKAGIKISPTNARYLVERAGSNLLSLDAEIEKLAIAIEEESVTQSAIDNLIATSRSASIYSFTDSITKRDFVTALRTVERLFEFGEPAIMIIAFVKYEIFNLLKMKAGRQGEEKFRGPSWKKKFYQSASAAWPREKIRDALITLSRADIGLKSGLLTDTEAILQVVTEMSLK